MLILLFRIVIQKKEIDKSRVTWLIIALVCLVLPIVGSMTIEWGDLKISWERLTTEAQIVNETIVSLTQENEELKGQITNLNRQIYSLGERLASGNVNQETRELVGQMGRDFAELEMRANSISQQTDIAKTRNQNLVRELEKKK